MGAEDRDLAFGDLVQLVDEFGTLGAQALDHVPVVHDLMPDIDRRPEFLDGPFDDFYRPLDAGAAPPR